MERKEQKRENTWAVEDLFPSDEAWWAAFEQAKAYVPRVQALEGRLGESAQTLLESL